jgi:hypothetical protein
MRILRCRKLPAIGFAALMILGTSYLAARATVILSNDFTTGLGPYEAVTGKRARFKNLNRARGGVLQQTLALTHVGSQLRNVPFGSKAGPQQSKRMQPL